MHVEVRTCHSQGSVREYVWEHNTLIHPTFQSSHLEAIIRVSKD